MDPAEEVEGRSPRCGSGLRRGGRRAWGKRGREGEGGVRGEERERAAGGGFRVFTVHRGWLKYAREVDVSWAWKLNVSGALELGGVHFFSVRQINAISGFSDRRANAKHEHL